MSMIMTKIVIITSSDVVIVIAVHGVTLTNG